MTFQEIKDVKHQILWDVTAEKNFKINNITSAHELKWGNQFKKEGYYFYIRVENQKAKLMMGFVENNICENICIFDMANPVLEQALSECGSSLQMNGVFPSGNMVTQILKGEINS